MKTLLLSLLLSLVSSQTPKFVSRIQRNPPLYADFVGCPENNVFYYKGAITSPLFPANYPNNDKCFYFVYARQGSVLRFDFDHFDLETCCDFVTIYDGRTEDSPVIAQFGGENRTASRPTVPLFSSTRYALVTFTSDKIINRSGFKMSYNSVYTATPCNRDIVLVVNGLSSVGSQQHFTEQLKFIATSLVPSWTVGPTKVRVVVNLQVEKDYAIVYDAKQVTDTRTLQETVLGLVNYVPDVLKNNSTDFESLFHYAESAVGFESNRLGERSGVGRVVIMFVAQNPTDSQDFNAATEFAHNMRAVDDTKVITVAMGKGIDVAKIGTLSYGEGFYFGADYSELSTLSARINAAICQSEHLSVEFRIYSHIKTTLTFPSAVRFLL